MNTPISLTKVIVPGSVMLSFVLTEYSIGGISQKERVERILGLFKRHNATFLPL